MGLRAIVASAYWRVKYLAADARLIGAGILKHHYCGLARIPECSVRLAGVGSVILRPRETDLASFRGIFHNKDYEFPNSVVDGAVRRRYEAIVAGGQMPVIVDAGAYVGAASLWFRSRFPQSHIVAIEPDTASFALLSRNLAGSGEATLLQAAIGATAGHVKVLPTADAWASQVERSQEGTQVVTLNEAFALVPRGEPFLAKINIEGFEEEVFSANLEWLDKVAVLFIEPHDWLFPGRHLSRSFQKALGDRDFHLFIIGPHLCYVRI